MEENKNQNQNINGKKYEKEEKSEKTIPKKIEIKNNNKNNGKKYEKEEKSDEDDNQDMLSQSMVDYLALREEFDIWKKIDKRCVIILDVPNIAMFHGKGKKFSTQGVIIVKNFWESKGYTVMGYIPQYYTCPNGKLIVSYSLMNRT